MVRNLMDSLIVSMLIMGMLLPTIGGQANATGTILLVSDSDVPGGFEDDHLDDTFVTFLEGLGHTVDTSGMNKAMREASRGGSGPDIEALNAADLVIISRRTNSGAYDDDNDSTLWNGVTSPMLLMNGFLLRESRWGWMEGSAIEEIDPTLDSIQITDPSHPYVAGLPTPATQVFDWSSLEPPESPSSSLDQLTFPPDLLPEASVAALLGDLAYVFDLPAGTDTVGAGTLGGKRAFVGNWAYPADGNPFGTYTTTDYDTLLTNAIDTLLGSGSLSGDFDGDLDVDGADFLAWQREFGSTYGASDLDDWQGNFGATAAVAAITAVPEPATWILAWVMAMAATGWRLRSFDASLFTN